MGALDGIKGLWDNLVSSTVVIGDAFESIKQVFGEIMLFFYEIYFFLVFALFLLITIGLFIVLPIYLIKQGLKNKKLINDILTFNFDLFRVKPKRKPGKGRNYKLVAIK